MASLAQQLRDVKEAVAGPERYLDLALALRRDKTKETLLWAGGRWDRLERKFLDHVDPELVAVVDLEESQVEFTLWFAEFLADYREGYPRDISLALVAGDRRGGKTFDTHLCQLAALIDVPRSPDGLPAIGWVISKSYRERDELEELLIGYIPKNYYRHSKAPEHRFTFAHGSFLRSLSADDPETLRQGRVDWLLYNEPQKMSPRAIKNGLYGTSDGGGLTVLAANPPSPGHAEWLIDLKEAIEEDPEIRGIAKFFNFDSKQNTKINQPARKRVGKLAKKIDPDGADADSEGKWVRWGDLAYPGWNPRPLSKGGLVGPVPEVGSIDVTASFIKRIYAQAFQFIIGGDFQRRPQAAAILKLVQVPDIRDPVYWFVDAVGVKGTEVELSTEVMGREYGGAMLDPETGLWIPDCTGSYQGADRIQGRTSFQLLREQGWRVEPAEIIKRPGKSDHPKNPDVMQRLGLMQRLMEARRIRVDPRADWLIEAFSKCQLRKTEYGRRVPKGQWAHITDAAGYPVWRLEPKPKVIGGKPRPEAIIPVTIGAKGPRIL